MPVNLKRLSEITPLVGKPALTDQLVAVIGGNDRLVNVADVGGRQTLMGDLQLYVTVTGSDSGDGSLANPWATPQHAANIISATLDIAGFQVFVNIGPGSFPPIQLPGMVGGGRVQFNGAGSSSTTIDATSGINDCFKTLDSTAPTACGINKVKLDSHFTNSSCVVNYNLCYLFVGDVSSNFDANDVYMSIGAWGLKTGAYGAAIQMSAGESSGGFTYDMPGFAFGFAFAEFGAAIILTGAFAATGTPQSTSATARTSTGAQIINNAASFTGAAVGLKFVEEFGSNIADNFANVNWLPGNTAGQTDDTSTYGELRFKRTAVFTNIDITLGFTNALQIIQMNSAAAHTVNVDTFANSGIPVGVTIRIFQTGTGAVTINALAGVTGNNFGAIGVQWGWADIYHASLDNWIMST